MGRMDRITGLAGQLAEDPKNEKLFQRMTITACMPSATNSGFQHLNGAKRPIEEKIGEIMAPQHAIIRRVLKRALDIAESELRKVEGKERKLAEDEGYDFVPSGKILALQKRILELRNGVALPIPGEDNYRGGLSGWLS